MAKGEEITKFISTLIEATVSFAQYNGYNQNFVVSALLGASGTFGRRMNKADFFAAINNFIRATRQIYPDFTFDYDPYLGMYKELLQQKALEEKQTQTVH